MSSLRHSLSGWQKKIGVPLGLILGCLLVAVAVVRVSPVYVALALISLSLLLLFLAVPQLFLLLLLLVGGTLDLLEGYRILANTPFSVNAAGLINVGVVCLTLLYVLLLKRGRIAVNKTLVYPYLLYLSWGAFSLLFSSDVNSGLRFFIALIKPFAVFFMISDVIKSKKQAQQFTWAIIAATLVPLSVGVYQTIVGGMSRTVLGYTYNRINATFNHPARYGMFLVFTVSPLLALYFETKKLETRLLWGLFVVSLMGSVVLTYIRIAWIALFAAVAIILAKRSRVLLVVLVIAVIVMIGAVPSLRTRIGSVLVRGRQVTLEQDPSTRFRSQAWGLALDLFRQQPVRGTGMGSYFPASAKIFGKATSPHNEYLRVLAETGVVGLALFVWALFSWVRLSARTLRSLTDPFFKSLALSALGASVAFILLCLTDNPLVYHSVNMYFWALLALVDAGRRIQDAEHASLLRSSAGGSDHG